MCKLGARDCREVLKQESMYGLSTKKVAIEER